MFGNFQKRVQDWYGRLKINAGSSKQPALEIAQTWDDAATTFTGIKANITNNASAAASLVLDLQVGGSSVFRVKSDGDFITGKSGDDYAYWRLGNDTDVGLGISTDGNGVLAFNNKAGSLILWYRSDLALQVQANVLIGWSSSSTNVANPADLSLYRDAADTLAQRRTTNAQTYRLYNTWTDASNYERLAFTWDSNTAKIQTEAAGTGTLRTLQLGPMYTATLKSGVSVIAVTTTASPAATDTGAVYTNEGDADGATVTLPTAAAGLRFTVYVQTAQTLTVTAGTGDTIRIASNVTAAAGSITSAVVGSCVSLLAINATEWVATSSVGSWSF